jgi:hypothetical protein
MVMAVNDPAKRARRHHRVPGGPGTPGFNVTRVDGTIGSEAIKLAERMLIARDVLR